MAVLTPPVVYADLRTADFRLAYLLEREIQYQLADRASIRNQISFLGDLSGQGSAAIKVRRADLGAATPMASAADGASIAGTNINTSDATVTIARSALRYDISDLSTLTGMGGGGDLNPMTLAAGMVESAEARLMQLICNTFSAATSGVGNTGVNLSVSTFLDAIYTLELADNSPAFRACLHPVQFTDLQSALRSENNNFLSYMPATAEIAAIKGQGYCGDLLGVSIWKSSHVITVNAAADRCGLIWADGGLGYAVGTPQPSVGATQIRPPGTFVTIEMQRDSSAGVSEVIGTLYAGASIIEQGRVCKIVSDA